MNKLILLIMLLASTVQADWPARVFAPYVWLGSNDNFQITECVDAIGGAAGSELGIAEKDPHALEAKYQSILDRYKFTWLDFDIEGKALRDEEANARRNTAIAAIQKRNPALRVTFTLPVGPDGISRHAQSLLADAKAKGVKIHSANIMVMDYGPRFSKDKKMSDLAITCAQKTHEQTAAIDPSISIGLCPMIGQNDVKEEIFSADDAKSLRDFAAAQPW